MRKSSHWIIVLSATVTMSVVGAPAPGAARSHHTGTPQPVRAIAAPAGKIEPYRIRLGRSRPVVAVIGENAGTELTDFVIPYSVLVQSGAADVITVATKPGVMKLHPALQIRPQATIRDFDERFPGGADYVIVPAVMNPDNPALLAWIAAQGAKGATVVSICDGALVVAKTGLMKGRRATGHWYTQGMREKDYPDTRWQKNVRYVADGKIVSSAGISAAIPTSLALVEAIAGTQKAAALATKLGAGDWNPAHDSDRFQPRFGTNLAAFAALLFNHGWYRKPQSVGVPVEAGIDEIALALTADAYSRTGRSQAYSLSTTRKPLKTRNGLIVVPDRVVGKHMAVDRVLAKFDATASVKAIDKALVGIATSYGRKTAYGVALQFEYPGFRY